MKKKILIVLAILQIALLVAHGMLGYEDLYYPLFLSAVFYTPFFILFTMLFLRWVNKNTSRRNYIGAYLAINCIVNMAASGIPLLVFMLIEKIRHKELNWEADWCNWLIAIVIARLAIAGYYGGIIGDATIASGLQTLVQIIAVIFAARLEERQRVPVVEK
mgnify:CR=1 FL=1